MGETAAGHNVRSRNPLGRIYHKVKGEVSQLIPPTTSCRKRSHWIHLLSFGFEVVLQIWLPDCPCPGLLADRFTSLSHPVHYVFSHFSVRNDAIYNIDNRTSLRFEFRTSHDDDTLLISSCLKDLSSRRKGGYAHHCSWSAETDKSGPGQLEPRNGNSLI